MLAEDDAHEEHFPAGEIGQVRRNRYLLGLAASPLFVAFGALVVGLLHDPRFLAGIFHPIVLAAALVGIVWVRNPRPHLRWPAIRASKSGLRVGDTFVPRARIVDGFYVPRMGRRDIVRLGVRGPRPAIELSVAGESSGRRLLRALALDTTQTVATFRLPSGIHAHRRVRWLLAAFAVGVGSFISIVRMLGLHQSVLGLFPLFFFALAFLSLAPSHLRVGTDGLVLRWLGRERFLPMREIRDVRALDHGFGRSRMRLIELCLHSGERVEVAVTQGSWDTGRREILLERIRQARAVTSRGDAVQDDAARLDRAERPVSAWVEELRALGSGALATHRIAPMAAETLWRVVEDPAARATSRAAAAIALAPTLDDEDRLRLKRVAQAVALPRLRVALEATAGRLPGRPRLTSSPARFEAGAEEEEEDEEARNLAALVEQEDREGRG